MGDSGKNVVKVGAGDLRMVNALEFAEHGDALVRDVQLTESDHVALLCALARLRGVVDAEGGEIPDLDALVHKLGGDPMHPGLGVERVG